MLTVYTSFPPIETRRVPKPRVSKLQSQHKIWSFYRSPSTKKRFNVLVYFRMVQPPKTNIARTYKSNENPLQSTSILRAFVCRVPVIQ